MIGIPGSGKSTWVKEKNEGWIILSPDAILEERYNYEWTPERASEAWAESYQRFGQLLLENKSIIWDATFTTPMMRSAILHISKGAGFRVEAVFCDTPIETCLTRNAARERDPVPESTIRRMSDSLIPPTESEGFDVVHHIQ